MSYIWETERNLALFNQGSRSIASCIIRILSFCPYIHKRDKGKVVPVFTEAPWHEDLWWSERIAPHISNIATRWR